MMMMMKSFLHFPISTLFSLPNPHTSPFSSLLPFLKRKKKGGGKERGGERKRGGKRGVVSGWMELYIYIWMDGWVGG